LHPPSVRCRISSAAQRHQYTYCVPVLDLHVCDRVQLPAYDKLIRSRLDGRATCMLRSPAVVWAAGREKDGCVPTLAVRVQYSVHVHALGA
jgi:hypothetical protein